ncbi:MAG: S41 family peptidase [Burkholderiaceae bacterium]|nr:S41 family peptidase [Burkholderiaceae bacterium]
MKNSIKGIALVLGGMFVGTMISVGFANPTAGKSALPLSEIRQFTDVYGAVKQFYVEPVEDKRLIKEAISGMLQGLDPHSAFLDEEAFKDLQEGTSGEFGGLGLEVGSDPAGVRVISPIDDTPAAQAGIRAGDIIFKIDGKLIRDMSLNDAVKLMRGKPKTSIELSIMRKGVGQPITIKLVRDIIKVKSVKAKALPDGMGYIRISQFQERTSSDLAKHLENLYKTGNLQSGIILDLRNDPGGLLNAAVGVSSAFLQQGVTVVSTKGQVTEAQKTYFSTPQDYSVVKDDALIAQLPAITKSVPMVVLVNGASASASEIVAGALQDHKRATIMGTKTFGKGSVQTIIPLRGDAKNTAIKLTTARYYTPNGRSIQAVGITPDVEVTDTATGNFVDFDIREADLANHLTQPDSSNGVKDSTEQNTKSKSAEVNTIKETIVDNKKQIEDKQKAKPKFYRYGDADDYQLQQAVLYLKKMGSKVHETSKLEVSAIKERVEPIASKVK